MIKIPFNPRQANDQGRVVAPITSLSTIRQIASQKDARLLLIVRHPFDRLEQSFIHHLHLFFKVGVCLQG